MKKIIAMAALTAVVFMSGCSGEKAKSVDGSIEVEGASMLVELPEGWTIFTGDSVYDEIYAQYSDDYDSADEMQSDFKTNGLEYIAYAANADGTAIVTVSVQDMLTGEDGETLSERASLEDYARTVHDTTIFEYFAGGYKTGSDSALEQTNGGWLSSFEILLPSEEEDGADTFVLGQQEYMTERGDDIYSVQICYSSEDEREEAQAIKISFDE